MACYVFNFNLHDLNLVEIGKQKCTPLYSFGPFIRNEYIFHYVISGKGFCSMGHDIQESSVQTSSAQESSAPARYTVETVPQTEILSWSYVTDLSGVVSPSQ